MFVDFFIFFSTTSYTTSEYSTEDVKVSPYDVGIYVRLDDGRSSAMGACGRRPAAFSRTCPSHSVMTVSSKKSTTIIRVILVALA